MGKWGSEVLHDHVAPGLVEFTAADIPDLRDAFPSAKHWLIDHFLNGVFLGSFNGKYRQLVLGYLRRCKSAFFSYHEARRQTLIYLERSQPNNPYIAQYFEALTSWENFCLQTSLAIDLFNAMGDEQRVFDKNDGSKEQRLYDLANNVKHPRPQSDDSDELSTLPIWLTNSGLESSFHAVTYAEAAELLFDASRLANELQDPHQLKKDRETKRNMPKEGQLDNG